MAEKTGTGCVVDEKRGAQRRRVLKGAIAAFNGHYSTYNCTLRDMSETGCRILVEDALKIPEYFDLIVELDGMQVPCQVMRRSRNELGVRFVGALVITESKRRSQVTQLAAPIRPVAMRRAVADAP